MPNYWKLTDKIYFGNRHAILELGGEVKSVLNLADNVEPGEYNPTILPPTVRYFHYPISDERAITVEEFDDLVYILRMVRLRGYFPILIHCRAGQERGPAVASLCDQMLNGTEAANARARVWELRDDAFRQEEFQNSFRHFQELFEGDIAQGNPARRTNLMTPLINRPNFDGVKEFGQSMWLRRACLPPPYTILDLGCNSGTNLLWCRGDICNAAADIAAPCGDAGGIDYHPDYPRHCIDVNYGREFYCLDLIAEQVLPFLDRSWDTVLCADVLTRVPKDLWVAILNEARRIARRQILLTAWDEGGPDRGHNIELELVPDRGCRRFLPCFEWFERTVSEVFGDSGQCDRIYGYFTALIRLAD